MKKMIIFYTWINNHRDYYDDLHKISFNCGSVDKWIVIVFACCLSIKLVFVLLIVNVMILFVSFQSMFDTFNDFFNDFLYDH